MELLFNRGRFGAENKGSCQRVKRGRKCVFSNRRVYRVCIGYTGQGVGPLLNHKILPGQGSIGLHSG